MDAVETESDGKCSWNENDPLVYKEILLKNDYDDEILSLSSEEYVLIPTVDALHMFTMTVLKQDTNLRKAKRNSGQAYFCLKSQKTVKARVQGPPCVCKLNCRQNLDGKHETIFKNFWNLGSYDQQNNYLFANIQVEEKKRSKRAISKKPQSRRTIAANYTVNIDGVLIEVCRTEFVNVHGLQNSRGRLEHILKMKKEGAIEPKPDGRGRRANRFNKLH